MFKNYKAEVENQLSKRLKPSNLIVGGEYYGRYDSSGEHIQVLLLKCGIVPQYTMPITLTMNGVVEK